MDPRGQPMYQHPRMTMMGQSDIGSVPGSIPINYHMGNHTQGNIGMQGATMSDHHANYAHTPAPSKLSAHQNYTQHSVRKEVNEEDRMEDRMGGAVQPKPPAELSPEENENDGRWTVTEVPNEDIKTEDDEDIKNFMITAHDIFLKISSKEIKIKEASDILARPYSFVYSRYQEFCDNITGKPTTKKARTKARSKKNRKKPGPKGRFSGKIFKCEDCPATFHSEYLIKRHSKVHLENNESHLCTACGMVFPKLTHMMAHRIEVHEDALQCPHCEKQFTVVASYKYHLKTHTSLPKQRPHVCTECGKGFFKKNNLEDHYRQHTGEKPFMCGYCFKTFITIGNLQTHMYVHQGRPLKKSTPKSKKFECKECGKKFRSSNYLMQHMNQHAGIKPYRCEMCDARFSINANLNRHRMLHTGEKPYKCNYCPAAFLLRSDLERHDMAHTGLKPFKCTMCDYSCVRQPNLEYHMNTHTGATPFRCDFYGCGAEYASPYTLKSHKLKHGPPPLKTCKVCKEKFPDMNSLKRHMMIHPGNKPVPCEKCDKIFYSESTLKRHMHVHMYKKPGKKNIVITRRRRNGGVKKAGKSVSPQKKLPSEYQGLAGAENGHASSVANSWTINAEDTNSQQSAHHFPASQFTNLNAWPTTMDPDELRYRLLNSFK